MTAIQNKLHCSWYAVAASALALIIALPLTTARADDDDDDWEDRREEYFEDLEEQREEARERWEEWREDRDDDYDDWRDRYGWHGHYAPAPYAPGYYAPQPGYYVERPQPVYRTYYRSPAVIDYHYETYPQYRYYGSPDLGYTEFGRERSVQIGPVQIFWDRD